MKTKDNTQNSQLNNRIADQCEPTCIFKSCNPLPVFPLQSKELILMTLYISLPIPAVLRCAVNTWILRIFSLGSWEAACANSSKVLLERSNCATFFSIQIADSWVFKFGKMHYHFALHVGCTQFVINIQAIYVIWISHVSAMPVL